VTHNMYSHKTLQKMRRLIHLY